MPNNTEALKNWAIHKIQTEYPEDIALLIGVNGHETNGDGHGKCFDYFIPATDRGYELAKTFIVEGIGYDLYPRSWELAEETADFKNTAGLTIANAVILYSRTEKDKERFLALQKRYFAHLNDSALCYHKALKKIQEATGIYQRMLFEEKYFKIKMAACYVFEYLAEAITLLNGTYVNNWTEGSFAFLKQMEAGSVPEEFLTCYEDVLTTQDSDTIISCAHHMIRIVRTYTADRNPHSEEPAKVCDYSNLAGWYQELSLWWKRLYYYCATKNTVMAYQQACYLQNELLAVGSEFSLKEYDIISSYDPENLEALSMIAHEAEDYIRTELHNHGIIIEEYKSLDAFLQKN